MMSKQDMSRLSQEAQFTNVRHSDQNQRQIKAFNVNSSPSLRLFSKFQKLEGCDIWNMKFKEKSQIDLVKIIFRKHSKAYFHNLFHFKIPSSKTLFNRGDRLLWQAQIREGMMSNTGSSIILRIRHVSSESRYGFFMLLFWPRWLAVARWLVVVANFVFQQE